MIATPSITSVAALAALLALSGCNSASQSVDTGGANPANRPISSVHRSELKLPEGAGCEGEAQRFRALIDHDLETGFVAKSVYNQAAIEIEAAEKVCAAGAEAKARTMLMASRRRYGYPS
jgi:hypothetical protein